MIRRIFCFAALAVAAMGSAQFYKGAQSLGEVIANDGKAGTVSFGVLAQPARASVTSGLTGSFKFNSTAGIPTLITMSRITKLVVSQNVADFTGPAEISNPLSMTAIRYTGILTVHVRDVVKPGSALTILDEISFSFLCTTTASQNYSFSGWARNGLIEVFGGYYPSTGVSMD